MTQAQLLYLRECAYGDHLKPVTVKAKSFRSSMSTRPISNILVSLFNEYGLVRRDFARWQLCYGSNPFTGQCFAAPSIRGEAVATNYSELLVVTRTTFKQAWFVNFKSFQCDNEALQGELNQCLLPFEWWWQSKLHRYESKASQRTRNSLTGQASTKKQSPATQSFNFTTEQLTQMFE